MAKIIFLLMMVCWFCQIKAQEKSSGVTAVLDSLSNTSIPQLNNKVDISFSNIAIKEPIRTIGNTTGGKYYSIPMSPTLLTQTLIKSNQRILSVFFVRGIIWI